MLIMSRFAQNELSGRPCRIEVYYMLLLQCDDALRNRIGFLWFGRAFWISHLFLKKCLRPSRHAVAVEQSSLTKPFWSRHRFL